MGNKSLLRIIESTLVLILGLCLIMGLLPMAKAEGIHGKSVDKSIPIISSVVISKILTNKNKVVIKRKEFYGRHCDSLIPEMNYWYEYGVRNSIFKFVVFKCHPIRGV